MLCGRQLLETTGQEQRPSTSHKHAANCKSGCPSFEPFSTTQHQQLLDNSLDLNNAFFDPTNATDRSILSFLPYGVVALNMSQPNGEADENQNECLVNSSRPVYTNPAFASSFNLDPKSLPSMETVCSHIASCVHPEDWSKVSTLFPPHQQQLAVFPHVDQIGMVSYRILDTLSPANFVPSASADDRCWRWVAGHSFFVAEQFGDDSQTHQPRSKIFVHIMKIFRDSPSTTDPAAYHELPSDLLPSPLSAMPEDAMTLHDLADMICHEIRNPLAGISGSLELIRSGLEQRRNILSRALGLEPDSPHPASTMTHQNFGGSLDSGEFCGPTVVSVFPKASTPVSTNVTAEHLTCLERLQKDDEEFVEAIKVCANHSRRIADEAQNVTMASMDSSGTMYGLDAKDANTLLSTAAATAQSLQMYTKAAYAHAHEGQTQRSGMTMVAFDPRRVVGEVAKMMRAKARIAGVGLRTCLPLDKVEMWGDPHRVQQVVVNLVLNAIHHTLPGGEVTVGVEPIVTWSKTTGSSVRDNAPGSYPSEDNARARHIAIIRKRLGLKPAPSQRQPASRAMPPLSFLADESETNEGVRVMEGGEEDPQALRPKRVRIYVTDTGVGMNAVECQGLFKKFSQPIKRPIPSTVGASNHCGDANHEHSESEGAAGFGLGLLISKRLVDSLGGRMGVESVKGKGSTFFFLMESRRPCIEAAADANAGEVAPPYTNQQFSRRRTATHDETLASLNLVAVERAHSITIPESSSPGPNRRSRSMSVDSCIPLHHSSTLLAETPLSSPFLDPALNSHCILPGSPTLCAEFETVPPTPPLTPYQGPFPFLGMARHLEENREWQTMRQTQASTASNVSFGGSGSMREDLAQSVMAEKESFEAEEEKRYRLPRASLIVEDNPINQRILTRFLASLGVPTITARDGLEALELLYCPVPDTQISHSSPQRNLSQYPPPYPSESIHAMPLNWGDSHTSRPKRVRRRTGMEDVEIVFMDVEMPRMDGITATREIRRMELDDVVGLEGPGSPKTKRKARNDDGLLCADEDGVEKKRKRLAIVGLSGNARSEHVRSGLEVGMDEYIIKPWRAEDISRVCRVAVE
ncbi:hypothetical protein HDU67_004857 [Dinochytrium kinnereticum]|nr:hypothetical protein HDU67_004857 [Dinochytrium kinnereticum]